MIKGMISGLIWGCVVAGIATVFLSLYAPLPSGAPAASTPDTDEPSEAVETSDAGAVETPGEQPEASAGVDATQEVEEAASESVTQAEAIEPETVVAEAPASSTETASGTASSAEATPSETLTEVTEEAATTEPAEPVEEAVTEAPEAEVEAEIETAEVQNDPPAAETTAPELNIAAAAPATQPTTSPDTRAPADAELSRTIPQPPAAPEPDPSLPLDPKIAGGEATAPEVGEAVADGLTEPAAPEGSPEIDPTEEQTASVSTFEPKRLKAPKRTVTTPQADTTPVPAVAPQPEPAPEPEETVEAQTEQDEDTQLASDTPLGLTLPQIDNPATSVVTNRLPSLRIQTPDATETPENSDETEAEVLDPSEVGALAAFRAATEVSPNASLFSIILIDVGSDGIARDKLLEIGLPVTVALDPTSPDVEAAMQAYRAAGFEVAMLPADLPTQATASDVEVALAGYFDVVSEAVAILDPLDGRIQGNRQLLGPVLGAVARSGHGFITYDRGLNSAQKAARRENIPEASVFRVLDGDLESSDRIKRYLDRAVFTANKDGHVVVLGRSYPETVTALLEWGLARKDNDLAIVPISVVMGAGS